MGPILKKVSGDPIGNSPKLLKIMKISYENVKIQNFPGSVPIGGAIPNHQSKLVLSIIVYLVALLMGPLEGIGHI